MPSLARSVSRLLGMQVPRRMQSATQRWAVRSAQSCSTPDAGACQGGCLQRTTASWKPTPRRSGPPGSKRLGLHTTGGDAYQPSSASYQWSPW
jgi:hypothetical protein